MVRLEKFVIHTTKYNDFINITDRVEELVEQSGIREGMALVMTAGGTPRKSFSVNLTAPRAGRST